MLQSASCSKHLVWSSNSFFMASTKNLFGGSSSPVSNTCFTLSMHENCLSHNASINGSKWSKTIRVRSTLYTRSHSISNNDVRNQQDATNSIYWSFQISSKCFRWQTCPSSGALFNCVYSFRFKAPILLRTGGKVPSQSCHQSAAISVHCTKSCIYSQKMLLRMGEFVAQNI